MDSCSTREARRLPRGWTEHIKLGLLHAVSLAATVLTLARGRTAESRDRQHRLQARLDRATTETALLREERGR